MQLLQTYFGCQISRKEKASPPTPCPEGLMGSPAMRAAASVPSPLHAMEFRIVLILERSMELADFSISRQIRPPSFSRIRDGRGMCQRGGCR